MRTDAKIGFAIGGVLLAVLTVYAIVVPKHSKKTNGTVALVKNETPTGADTPVASPLLGADGSGSSQTPVMPLKDTPAPLKETVVNNGSPKENPPIHSETPSSNVGPLGSGMANSDMNMGGPVTDLTRRDPKPSDRTAERSAIRTKPSKMVKPIAPFEVPEGTSETDRYYTIQAGQTLSKIAYEVYGNPRCYVAIQRENRGLDPAHLKVGSKIKLPDISLPTEATTTAEGRSTDRAIKASEVEMPLVHPIIPSSGHTYTVQSGDSLYAIARKQLGSGRKADLIYDLNKDTIGSDKSRLKLGMVLKLPSLAE